MINFDMYTTALRWGSESDAFRKSSGGLTYALWVREGLEGKLKIKQPPDQIRQLVSQADIYYAGFANNIIHVFNSYKSALRLEFSGQVEQSALRRTEAFQSLEKARRYADIVRGIDKRINEAVDFYLQVTMTEMRNIQRMTKITLFGLSTALFVFMLAVTVFFYERFIHQPIQALMEGTRAIGQGDLGRKISLRQDNELGQLARTLNKMAEDVRMSRDLLKVNEAKLQNIFNNALDAVITIDNNGIVTDWNQQAEAVFGWSPKEARGQLLSSLIIPARYREAHQRGLKRYFETGEGPVLNKRIELTGLHRNGHEFDVELAITPVKAEDSLFFSAFLRDITERKRSEEQIRKLSRAVEQSPISIIITDEQGVIEYANPRFVSLTGYEAGEAVGKFVDLFKKWEVPNQGYARLWETMGTKEEWEGEFLNERKDGSKYWEYVSVSPIMDQGNRITNFLVIIQDITQRKEAEEEMKRALAMKSDFVSVVSHELRTPLAISKEAISLILREKVGPISEKQKEVINIAGSNVDRLGVLINDILDSQKIEFGNMQLNKENIDIVKTIEESWEGWQLSAASKKIQLLLSAPKQPLFSYLDKKRITQILSNLISNAVKFTPEGGSVEVGVKEKGEMVEISVKDTGPGIVKEDIPKLFQKFQQLKRTYKPGLQGTGLGLSIAKSLVELHQGKIWVTSALNQGAIFTFVIPKHAA
jgi:PAS domain S-box-containing protein